MKPSACRLLFCFALVLHSVANLSLVGPAEAGQTGAPPSHTDNPFFKPYPTPFNVPPFDLIKNEHFLPAIEEGIKREEAEIEAIVNNPDPPTFENTIAALDHAGIFLDEVTSV
ncbi:MAG: hypothetical protein ACUVV5_12310, partial [Candidatus Aminicenantales bacterium]